MKKIIVECSLFLVLALTLLAGCSGDSGTMFIPNPTAPLSANNVNLIFLVSPDLAYSTPGDIQPDTANLTSQGLNRSLMLATYLKQQVLGGKNVNSIYTISPMSHLQTANNYPDMAAIGFIQQFALLNQITLNVDANGGAYPANNYPINVSYARAEGVPDGVTKPALYCTGHCSGLDFKNTANINDTLVSGIIDKKTPGFYVFSAPWETVSTMMTNINTRYGYNLSLPTAYQGSNYVYALSIPTTGNASLVSYNSNLAPSSTYPVLPSPVPSAACTNQYQPYFSTVLTGGVNGITVPSGVNTNSTIYVVRHAEAHPDPNHGFDDGNYVAAGQWRALSLANALRGKIAPNAVYSIDPAGMWYLNPFNPQLPVSYVRPSLTVLPYAIANNLPYRLAAGLTLGDPYNPAQQSVAQNTSNFFFFRHADGSSFSNQTLLVAWESGHIKPFINALLTSYGVSSANLLDITWPSQDYDIIWTLILDANGNLTVHNAMCEGIDSSKLTATAPLF
jgi:hypothetical protein